MKVIFIITSLEQGGIETYLIRFLEKYGSKIQSIVICIKNKKNSYLYNRYKEKTNEIIFLPSGLSKFIFTYKFIKKNNDAVVCDFRGTFSAFTILIAYFNNVKKRIVFYRESQYQFKANILKDLYVFISKKIIIKYSTSILSNSQAAFNNFFKDKELMNKNFKVIRNGVFSGKNILTKDNNLRKELGLKEDFFIIGHVGRYTNAKNFNVMIKIANILCKNDSNIYFLFCGKGVCESLDKLVIDTNIRSKIITPGHCENINDYYSLMNIFLFPSINEGQPNALIEALLNEIPIVASNIQPIIETLPKEIHPFLSNPSDFMSFINYIKRIQSKDNLYDAFSAKKWAETNFCQKKRFLDFYNHLYE